MKDPTSRSSSRCPADPNAEPDEGRECPDNEPAQERGERLDTGRAISRGGKASGDVPGATGQGEATSQEEGARGG